MSLRRSREDGLGDYIDGRFCASPRAMGSIDAVSPADLDDSIGSFAWTSDHAGLAVAAARGAFRTWRRRPQSERSELLRAYGRALDARRSDLTIAVSRAIGKPLWEAKTEVDAMIAKVDITLGAGLDLVRPQSLDAGTAAIRFRPIGVCAVIGPFNFPGHLPNGHIVPALASGNTVVFKPSEKAPEVGEIVARCMHDAGMPPGVFNLVQGPGDVARALVENAEVDAVMFTGSTHVGSAILAASAKYPGRLLALEMGGRNAALVLDDADVEWAAREIAFAAYVTAGQRCTATGRVLCARRVADDLLARLRVAASETRVGPPDGDDVFLGPVISDSARELALRATRAATNEYEAVVEAAAADVPGVRGWYLRPGLYVRRAITEAVPALGCEELFAPVLTFEVFDDDDEAVARANQSRYGLAACVFSARRERFERLAPELEVGVCNWNRGTVGSSSKLPFGGLKDSGNHRPAGLYSMLYGVDPVGELWVANTSPRPPLAPGLRVG